MENAGPSMLLCSPLARVASGGSRMKPLVGHEWNNPGSKGKHFLYDVYIHDIYLYFCYNSSQVQKFSHLAQMPLELTSYSDIYEWLNKVENKMTRIWNSKLWDSWFPRIINTKEIIGMVPELSE